MKTQALMHQFEQTAEILADKGLDEASWVALRPRVIDLIQRGSALTTDSALAGVHWDEAEAPVLLARAFGTVHARLAATVKRSAVTVAQPAAA